MPIFWMSHAVLAWWIRGSFRDEDWYETLDRAGLEAHFFNDGTAIAAPPDIKEVLHHNGIFPTKLA
jgi:hypothetical protein